MKKFTIDLVGTKPILMHSARLSDRLDPVTKAVTEVSTKKHRSYADDMKLSHLEWLGGMYWDEVAGPYLPGENIARALLDGVRKLGGSAEVGQSFDITSNINPIAYSGPREVRELWADKRYVYRKSLRQFNSRVVRTRPIFREWRTQAEGIFDDRILSLDYLRGIAEATGMYIGIGDWRPRFGTFTTDVASV